MSIAEYNIRILISHVLVIAGALWILREWIQAAKVKARKIARIVVTVMILLAFVFSLFACLSYRDCVSDYGKIVDTSYNGSYAGILDSYSVRIEKPDGTATWYNISIFSSSSFKDSVQQLEIGDYIEVYANNFFNVFYRYEKIDGG